jgi:hypothetical protein
MLDDFDQEVELQELRDALVRQQRATRKAHAKSEAIVEAVYQAAKDAAVTLGRAPSVPKPKTDPRRKNPEVALIHAARQTNVRLRHRHLPETDPPVC